MSRYRRLGRTGLRVSPLCLGTANFGWVTDPSEAHLILSRALEHGIQFVDTANSYNRNAGENSSESILGRWLSEDPARRHQIVLATKVYSQVGDGPNDRGLSARHIKRACEDSLRRLGTDHIDLYQMHHVDRETPWEEIWQAMEVLIQEGKILYVGSSNFAAWHVALCHQTARQRHLLGLVSEQSSYNLTQRSVELEVLPACRELGLGFLAYGPLASGALSSLDSGEGRRRLEPEAEATRRRLTDSLCRYGALCEELGMDGASLALAWLLHQPGVTSAVVGPRTEQQLDALIAARDTELEENVLRRLDEIWSHPGAAPEAYAW